MANGQQGQMGKMQTNAQKLQQYPTGASQLMAGAKGVTPYTPQTFNTPPPVGGVEPGPPGGVTIPGGALPPRDPMGGGEAPGRSSPGGVVPGPPGGVTIPGGALPPRGGMGGGEAPGRMPSITPGPPITIPGGALPPRSPMGPSPLLNSGPTTPDINVPTPYSQPGGGLAAQQLGLGLNQPTPRGNVGPNAWGKLKPGGLPIPPGRFGTPGGG
jgi:hypothetical protein